MTRLALIGCLFLAAFALAVPAGAGENFRIGVCVMGERHPYFRDMLDEIIKEAEKVGVAVIPGNADFNHERQVRVLEDYINQRVSMILVAPYDARQLVPTLEKAGAAGIPVMSIDSAIGGYPTISHCGSDNAAGGRLAAGMMLERLEEKHARGGMILALDHVGVTSTYLRVKGFRDVMALRGGHFTIVAADGRGEADEALEKTKNMLASVGPELVGVFASNDGMSMGALQALEEAGRTASMTVIGFDDTAELRRAVDEEKMAGIVVQFPRAIGKRAFEIAYAYLTGRDSQPPYEDLVEVGTYDWEGLVDQRGNVIERR